MGCCFFKGKSDPNLENELHHLTIFSKTAPPDALVPEIGFVVKTHRLDNTKVFINIFYHANVRKIYLSSLVESKDRSGSSCLVYSCIVPYKEYKNTEISSVARNKLCTEVISLINTTHKEQLMTNYTTPRIVRGYMGDTKPIFVDIPQDYLVIKSNGSANSSIYNSSFKEPHKDADIDSISLMTCDKDKLVPTISSPLHTVEQQREEELHDTVTNEQLQSISKPTLSDDYIAAVEEIVASSSAAKAVSLPETHGNATPWGFPEFHRGWAKKRGHINTALRDRYFTIDRGTIFYFAEESHNPPFGEKLKGCLYIAHYTVTLSRSDKESLIHVVPESDLSKSPTTDALASPKKHSIPNSDSKKKGKDLVLSFHDGKSAEMWKEVIESHILWANEHPEYEHLADAFLEESKKSQWLPNLMLRLNHHGSSTSKLSAARESKD